MKRDLTHSFVLMFILLLAVGAVLYYSDLKFTGYDVSDGTTEETTDTTTTDTETEITETEETETTETEEETDTETETTEIEETEITETTENISVEITEETETTDINITELSSESICTPDWQCESWTSCDSGTQTRACIDVNTCDSQDGIPAITQSCTYCGDSTCDSNEDCDSCSSDCGECEEEEEETDTSSEDDSSDEVYVPTTTLITTNAVTAQTCTPSWTCGDWQECIDSVQIRACTDVNTCDSQEGIPITTQSCVVEIKETCFDEIRNQDEENVDCGGVCERKCGFFTIVGSVVSGSVEVGKKFIFEEMFGNVTKIIISVGSLVFIIGGFMVVRFFIGRKKGKNKLDNAIDNLSGKKDSGEDTPKDDPKVEYYY